MSNPELVSAVGESPLTKASKAWRLGEDWKKKGGGKGTRM